ncbi:MAG: hypothetical protein ACLR8X_01125 [Gallintestinimicrobium sp.]
MNEIFRRIEVRPQLICSPFCQLRPFLLFATPLLPVPSPLRQFFHTGIYRFTQNLRFAKAQAEGFAVLHRYLKHGDGSDISHVEHRITGKQDKAVIFA